MTGAAVAGQPTGTAVSAGGGVAAAYPAMSRAAQLSSLPPVTDGHRPGPSLLYRRPATAPQLTNRPGSGWHAAPLLVSGASGYVDGEYLYQGYLFDDHGGKGVTDAANDHFLTQFLFAAKTGTLTYPTGPAFHNSAADLLEFRVRPTPDATAIRVTLNTLAEPARTAFTVAIGTSSHSVPWPDDAGVQSPAAMFLTVHGNNAQLVRASSGAVVLPNPSVRVDAHRRQFDVRILHAAWDPGSQTVRFAAGVGLWDVKAGHYLVPGATATATTPGGVSPSREALFDMAFRSHEPMPDWNQLGLSMTLGDAAANEQAVQHCFWRECEQGTELAVGNVSPFHAEVDFAALRKRKTELAGLPRSGFIDRIMPSHFSFGQGINYGNACGRFPVTCKGILVGNLQPYEIYVPPGPAPAAGYGLTLQLHASGGNYNEYMRSRNQSELGNRSGKSIVITPMARDADGDYTDMTEADAFEAWADLARYYRLDPSRTVITGYSMGGGGTYKLMERWPDLFARGFGIAALPYDGGFQGQWATSMRNVPLLVWVSATDEASPIFYARMEVAVLEKYGLRFTLDDFLEGDHITLATNDQYEPVAKRLGDATVTADPRRITFVVDRRNDFPKDGTVANHAYWLSGMKLRSRKNPAGHIDATSFGFGQAEPVVRRPSRVPTIGVVSGGHHGPMPYLDFTERWAPVQRTVARDRLSLRAANLARLAVDATGALIDCDATIHVHSDGPLDVAFPACHRVLHFAKGSTTKRL
ncbi:MAG TPA: hypothetical protein VHC43_15110 [Mycobacteriales bacterium]|nr:hypothetical protein [Mycobacteriales bacterium]